MSKLFTVIAGIVLGTSLLACGGVEGEDEGLSSAEEPAYALGVKQRTPNVSLSGSCIYFPMQQPPQTDPDFLFYDACSAFGGTPMELDPSSTGTNCAAGQCLSGN